MVGVFVTFRYAEQFDERIVQAIADRASARFQGMPGLRSKAFTVNAATRVATNFYVWESEEQARAFFTDELRERVTSLYGVAPVIEFVKVCALVENAVAVG